MSKRKLVAVWLFTVLGGAATASADTLHVAADTMVLQADPNRAFGDDATTVVKRSPDEIRAFLRFDLAALGPVPAGAPVRQATLRVWLGTGIVDGSLEVHGSQGSWDERTLTWNTVPSLGGVVSRATVTRDDEHRYLALDVTALVQDWLNGAQANEGLALLPDGRIQITLDTKENTGTSHPAELEVVMEDADSGGDVTAVNTPAGSGLQGGAASGDASLSLLTGCGSGQILKWTGSAWACAADLVGGPGSGWSLSGNAGTTAGADFLGTTDDQPLEFKVNGARVLRIEPPLGMAGPNIIGGHSGNSVTAGFAGAVIGGGGRDYDLNRVTFHFGTIGGGLGNVSGGGVSTVAGGYRNTASGGLAAIAGGVNNNVAEGQYSSIGGGWLNVAAAYGATVPGGKENRAGGWFSLASGSRAVVRNATEAVDADGDEGTFVWADYSDPNAYFTSTGPNQFLIRATNGVAINTNMPAVGSALTVNGNTTLTGNTSTNGAIGFGNTTRQMLNLYATAYGIGVQSYSFYSRSDSEFAWFRGGVHHDGTGNPGSGGTRQMRLDGNGNLFVRGTVNPNGADFAEMLPADDGVEPGDVVAIGRDGRLVLSTEPYQDTLAGVHSTKPALLGGAQDGADMTGKIPLAISGIVPVKVTDENGTIVPGDLLTSSSTPGRAMKASKIRVGGVAFYPSGVILGKALQPLASGEGVVEALVVLQ